MIETGRHFDRTSLEGGWEIRTKPPWTEGHLKNVVIELGAELGFGELISADQVSNKKDRGDLIDKTNNLVIEIEHDWRNFISHGHEKAKMDVLILGPDSDPVPEHVRKNLPKKIIKLTHDQVEKWRRSTKERRKKIAEEKKIDAATNILIDAIREHIESHCSSRNQIDQCSPKCTCTRNCSEPRSLHNSACLTCRVFRRSFNDLSAAS